MENLKRLSLKVEYEQPLNEAIALTGFLFNCNGRLLQSQAVTEGTLNFNLADNNSVSESTVTAAENIKSFLSAKQLRLFIAPTPAQNVKSITSMEELDNLKPYEPVLNADREGKISILPLPNIITQFWPFCRCRVTGKVSKWNLVGNNWQDQPVCRARVHICDVDIIRYWIYKIPDFIIARIPKLILDPKEIIKRPFPVPEPEPFSRRASFAAPISEKAIFKTTGTDDAHMAHAAKLPELSMEARQNLASGNINLVRETILNNYASLHPWLCLWPWTWPYFYKLNELKVVYTDAAGRFDTQISYNCFRDRPDIYIWVEYMINGSWETVYRPAVPCNVRWDYNCGTNINIHVTDPRVPVNCCCDCHLPGELVWVRAVGNTSISHIKQESLLKAPVNQTVLYDRIGLTDSGAAGDPSFLPVLEGDFIRPFGGSPTLNMGFGSSLPNTNTFYYRWSYRQRTNADLVSTPDVFKPLLPIYGELNKGYQYEYTDANGDTQSAPNSVRLGPNLVAGNDNLYIIPPERPNMAPFNVPEASPDWHQPTDFMNSIGFNSATLKNNILNTEGADGLYEFKLELFNQAGTLITAVPRNTFKVPKYTDASLSENAPDILLANETATTAAAFNMLMRIDNSKCEADIYTLKVNGNPAATDCCGFASYRPGSTEADLEITFKAVHDNDFAVFSFGVVKGTCGGVSAAGATGMVIDSDIVHNYAMSAGIYGKHFTPADLLGDCYAGGTGKAAFAESLHVAAMATDGYARLSGNDAGSLAAFALEP